MNESLIEEAAARAADARDAMLLERLRELGPGWAVGYRGKHAEFSTRPVHLADNIDKIEWELHSVELVDGELPVGHADFHYVVLKSQG